MKNNHMLAKFCCASLGTCRFQRHNLAHEGCEWFCQSFSLFSVASCQMGKQTT